MTPAHNILEIAEKTISKYQMLKEEDVVIIALSGGPDSTALLEILFSIKERYKIRLIAAHLNHMWRGKEAEKDADFAADLAKKLNLPFMHSSINVPEFAKRAGLSSEEASRHIRYKFLKRVASEKKADKVALGHTLDDQAETMLMRLLRGAGTKGLAGMPPVRTLGKNISLIRPLLETSRADIETYLREIKIKPRQDKTNSEIIFLRNRIRNELLPILSQYNPLIKENLSRLSRILLEEEHFIDGEAKKRIPEVLNFESGRVKINLRKLSAYSLPLKRRIVRYAVKYIKRNLRGIEYKHWEEIDALLHRKKTGSRANLPGGVIAEYAYEELNIFRERQPAETQRYELKVPGFSIVGKTGYTVKTALISEMPEKMSGDGKALFDMQKISPPLYLRFRQEGDTFNSLGLNGTKKLKDFFIDRKVPREERSLMPIILDAKGIIWVSGFDWEGRWNRKWSEIDERTKLTDNTKKILEIFLEKF